MGGKPRTAAQTLGRARSYSATGAVWRQHGAGIIFTSSRSISELQLWSFFVFPLGVRQLHAVSIISLYRQQMQMYCPHLWYHVDNIVSSLISQSPFNCKLLSQEKFNSLQLSHQKPIGRIIVNNAAYRKLCSL